jgi:GNAT superfamily N-acetyltransferase
VKFKSVPTIRAYQASDHERCDEIFRANEGRFVPAGYFEEFQAFLGDEHVLKLVVEAGGSVAGIGGIHYWHTWDRAFLLFGLIHPDLHRRRLGSILLLARLALLEPASHTISVHLHATDHSCPFFQKLGFGCQSAPPDAQGNAFYDCHLALTASLREQCRAALARSGVVLPQNLAVPITLPD